jgi:N-acetylneuraminic acid mutarotase
LPTPVSNNSVAEARSGKHSYIFSLMGIGSKKTWDSVINQAFALDLDGGKWIQINPVPGPAGRIAASAIGVRGQIFLFGGYAVDAQGGEITVPDVAIYDPLTAHWSRGADIPTPVDDAVIGVFRDRYIFLVSGWSNKDTVNNVQVYDVDKDKWSTATPVPGTPVFAHAGTLVGDTIIYVDGARKVTADGQTRYEPSEECWMGKIDHRHPEQIQWSKLPPHPGTARFRIASGGSEKDQKIYFAGGSDNPYSFNGVGYDGNPAEPSSTVFDFNLRNNQWEIITDKLPDATMDNRGMVVTADNLILVGGMEKGQQVTAKVSVIPKPSRKK